MGGNFNNTMSKNVRGRALGEVESGERGGGATLHTSNTFTGLGCAMERERERETAEKMWCVIVKWETDYIEPFQRNLLSPRASASASASASAGAGATYMMCGLLNA